MVDDSWLYARNEDPDTSHEAADRLALKQFWKLVVEFLIKNDRPWGWTWSEMDLAIGSKLGECGWHRVSDCRRLKFADWAYDDAGFKIKRQGPSHRLQGATRVTDLGRSWYVAVYGGK